MLARATFSTIVRSLLLAATLAVATGQTCTSPSGPTPGNPDTPPNFSVASACGLLATECVPLAGSFPLSLAAGDLDGNGSIDLAVVNFGTDNVTLLLNQGDASYRDAGNLPVGDSPMSVALADFDNDGRIDLVTSAAFDLWPYRNDGIARMTLQPLLSMDSPCGAVAAADLDNDGWPDLATSNGFGFDAYVFYNDGRGGFAASPVIQLSTEWAQFSGIAAADLNGDGLQDLLVLNRFSGGMSVLINKGNRVFAEPVDVTFSPKHILNMFVAGDVNGDGLPDVIVLDNGNPFEPTDVGRVVILIGNGAGGFADPVFLAAGKSPTHAAITDLDRDGHADLLVANNVSDDLSLFRGRGDGTFGEPETIPAGDGPAHVAAADLDGDGDPDLAVANASGNSVSIFLNDGAGRFTAGG